jgi:hypothetical protein
VSLRSGYDGTSAAQLRHPTNHLGERPCLLDLDRHAPMAYRWSLCGPESRHSLLLRASVRHADASKGMPLTRKWSGRHSCFRALAPICTEATLNAYPTRFASLRRPLSPPPPSNRAGIARKASRRRVGEPLVFFEAAYRRAASGLPGRDRSAVSLTRSVTQPSRDFRAHRRHPEGLFPALKTGDRADYHREAYCAPDWNPGRVRHLP